MRVLVLLAVALCGTVCVQALYRPLPEWPKDILHPETATCDKVLPNFYSYEKCLTTNRGDASASKCKRVVESCKCIPQFVKDAVSRVTKPNDPYRNVCICAYLVYEVKMAAPACCTKYFQPNHFEKGGRGGMLSKSFFWNWHYWIRWWKKHHKP